MNFIPYHKINNLNNIDNVLIELCKKIDNWCVCEKVHGANFGFHWFQESNSIKYIKRTSFIEENDSFFDYKEMLPNTLFKIEIIIKMLNEKYSTSGLEEIIIFGELFGGIYPNIKSKYKAIQKEVYYSPDLHFYAFDIYIKKNNEENGYFLDYKESCNIFESVQLLYAKPLAIYEKFEDALEHNIHYNSTIPEILGLPKLEINKAEGVILRNMKAIDKSMFQNEEDIYNYLPTKIINKYLPTKIIIKLKIPEFTESKQQKKIKNKSEPEQNTLKDWQNKAKAQMSKNRLQNTISKIGTLNENNRNDIYKLYVDDIMEEINGKDIPELKEWLYKIHKL
jgi:Rnl2 family RNA ligase